MKHKLEVCPICEEKKLVGLHKKACMRNYPTIWAFYEAAIREIAVGRKGRQELIETLR